MNAEGPRIHGGLTEVCGNDATRTGSFIRHLYLFPMAGCLRPSSRSGQAGSLSQFPGVISISILFDDSGMSALRLC